MHISVCLGMIESPEGQVMMEYKITLDEIDMFNTLIGLMVLYYIWQSYQIILYIYINLIYYLSFASRELLNNASMLYCI